MAEKKKETDERAALIEFVEAVTEEISTLGPIERVKKARDGVKKALTED